ncbi:efflux transporter outer membrane subunit [Novosphingobium olei]|uniref:efflux transporter outer membrane subunit n=1 Tax=Novosphingobium olei TaxID=2728851 RepID=UPI00308B6394|nr:efflux transporter outer membrane subunit [Novosphingobium olei]
MNLPTTLRRKATVAGMLALLLATSGCASVTRSTYKAPATPVAQAFDLTLSGSAATGTAPWWNNFDDRQLSAVVDEVLAANPNLAAAGLTLRQARLSSQLSRQNLFPSGSASASAAASKPLDGNGAGWNRSSSAALDTSWEIDLFGRLDAAADAARWEAEATQSDLASTRLSLIGTTVTTWWQLAYANQTIALGETGIERSRKSLQLVRRSYDAGAVSALSLREAEQDLASLEAQQTQLVQARVQALKTLAALMGRQGYDGPQPTALPDGELPTIPAGVPAQLLARRPDLAAAEQRLRGALATSDANVASYYPRFSLTGSLGGSSTSLTGFLSNPIASIGALFSLPELNPEKIRLGTAVARTTYRIAAEQFRTTFYNALRDTQIALSAREQYVQQAGALQAALVAAEAAEQLYQRQYDVGLIPLRTLIDARERTRTARTSVIQNRFNAIDAQIQVYQSLGGDALAG